MKAGKALGALLIACCLLSSSAVAQEKPAQEKKASTELVVAAAADLSSVLQEISTRYEKKTGVTLKLSFGASGALTQQIQNGAPFDVFFSADMDYPRQLITAGNQIVGSALDPEGREAREVVDEAERAVFEIAERGSRGKVGFRTVKSILPDVVNRIDELYHSDGSMTGIATGFKKLDEMTSGLQPGDLIIIAGRPSMGKSTLAVNIAENAALGSNKSAAIFSMEMSAESLTLRMISSLGRINQSNLRSGRLEEQDWPRIDSAMTQLSNAKIFIDETPGLTPTEIRARSRRLKRERGLDLIVVDYLQLMQVAGTKENRATEISEISRSLKALAKELKVPVIALSQLNRAVEQRVEKKPVMSDLRESGSIEQDSDLILLIYREEVYDVNTTRKGIADIIIAKQRNGPIGDVQLTFLGQYTKFENYAPESYAEGVFR